MFHETGVAMIFGIVVGGVIRLLEEKDGVEKAVRTLTLFRGEGKITLPCSLSVIISDAFSDTLQNL